MEHITAIKHTTNVEQYWQEQINLKQQSGLTRAAYCKKHNLRYHTFAYWEYKKPNKKASRLLPVKLIHPQNDNSVAKSKVLCSVMLKKGAELKIYDPNILSTLLPLLD